MSRIDEALRQAGRKTPAASTEDPDASLNAFPVALAEQRCNCRCGAPWSARAIHESRRHAGADGSRCRTARNPQECRERRDRAVSPPCGHPASGPGRAGRQGRHGGERAGGGGEDADRRKPRPHVERIVQAPRAPDRCRSSPAVSGQGVRPAAGKRVERVLEIL